MMFEEQLKQLYKETDRGLWQCKCCEATCEDLNDLMMDAIYHTEDCLAGRLTWFSYEITTNKKYYDRDNYVCTKIKEPNSGRDLEVLSRTVGNILQIGQDYNRGLQGDIVNRQVVLPFTEDENAFSNSIINPIVSKRKKAVEDKILQEQLRRNACEARTTLENAKRIGLLSEEEYQEKLKKIPKT